MDRLIRAANLIEVDCMAHARRALYDLVLSYPPPGLAYEALVFIGARVAFDAAIRGESA